ncbi:hypothetical protein [Occallatibacter savannae]|uniref:hypothetical protein n=1 Tax=Occallatibacter savannae TaxID=1002691 RepID=UPI0013A550CF|nr:hypothetical protein [Occallatibacter savannae]
MRLLCASVLVLVGSVGSACISQTPGKTSLDIDTDHDGLADSLEQSLLEQFQPRFLISRTDCSSKPAEFTAFSKRPIAADDNGTIYGQAFPSPGETGQVELHYYDLWRRDCGKAGHDLDAEHVSALVARDEEGTWKARYWYAAAHEDTLCDASQVARARGLDAETHGPEVWISAGKHAAFLSKTICTHGCGADRCGDDDALDTQRIVNLGESTSPMNGAIWTASTRWPLKQKMSRSDFDPALLTRVNALSVDQIAWANPGKRPAQAAILGGGAALGAAATGVHATDNALDVADTHTSGALDTASQKTGNALAKSYRSVKKALKAATGASTKAPQTE